MVIPMVDTKELMMFAIHVNRHSQHNLLEKHTLGYLEHKYVKSDDGRSELCCLRLLIG